MHGVKNACSGPPSMGVFKGSCTFLWPAPHPQNLPTPLLDPVSLCAKINYIPISLDFPSFALPIYREILKKSIKGAITQQDLKKNIFLDSQTQMMCQHLKAVN